jgi:hypothetical protein
MYYIIPLALFVHFWSTKFVWNTGTRHYKQLQRSESTNIKDNQKDNQEYIYDIVHFNTRDYSEYNYSKNWFLLAFLIPMFINFERVNTQFLKELVVKFCLILIIRSVMMMSTILPRQRGCEVKSLGLFNYTIGGTCYDKMFSGHFAFGLLLTLLILRYNIVDGVYSMYYFIIINTLHFFILTITRSHYTVDLLVAILVTFFVNEYVSV